jgi:hypothetical protein
MYLDKEEEEEVFRQRRSISTKKKYFDKEEFEVFETLCFNFCGISEKKLKYLDKDQKTINDVFETLCFNFCVLSEKKLKYLDKDGKRD